MKTHRFIVITTIHPKSEALSAYERQPGWRVVVAGDKKSAPIDGSAGLAFLSAEAQSKMDFELSGLSPWNHYSRKNIGYLYAMRQGADVIFDSDDDSVPYPDWRPPEFSCADRVVSERKFVNVYSHFSKENIWPRGFPLDEIQYARQGPFRVEKTPAVKIGVWQGLDDDDPDTDAIFRLVVNRKVLFEKNHPLYLPQGRLCPVNSQNTLWRREAFPYLYLPVTVGFRSTDIVRGYIAQILMGRRGFFVGWTGATLIHRRNPHDLMNDLAEEFDSYVRIKPLVDIIEETESDEAPDVSLRNVYRRLADAGFVKPEELLCLDAWIRDYQACGASRNGDR